MYFNHFVQFFDESVTQILSKNVLDLHFLKICFTFTVLEIMIFSKYCDDSKDDVLLVARNCDIAQLYS